jgi:hypothetical protein
VRRGGALCGSGAVCGAAAMSRRAPCTNLVRVHGVGDQNTARRGDRCQRVPWYRLRLPRHSYSSMFRDPDGGRGPVRIEPACAGII